MNSETTRHNQTDSLFSNMRLFVNNLSLTFKYIIFSICIWILPPIASKLIGFALPSLPGVVYVVGSLLFWEFGSLYATKQFLKGCGYRLSKGSFAVIIYCILVFHMTIPHYSMIQFVISDPILTEMINSSGYRLGIPCLLLMLILPTPKTTDPQKNSHTIQGWYSMSQRRTLIKSVGKFFLKTAVNLLWLSILVYFAFFYN